MNLRNLGLHDILIEQNRNVIWIYMRYILFLKAKYIVRSGIRTHAHIRGPERSVSWWTRRWYLESGALDHSAILTADPYSLI